MALSRIGLTLTARIENCEPTKWRLVDITSAEGKSVISDPNEILDALDDHNIEVDLQRLITLSSSAIGNGKWVCI